VQGGHLEILTFNNLLNKTTENLYQKKSKFRTVPEVINDFH
jgi:hypothetical protein